MTDLATLGFKVDTSGLAAGATALDQFGAKAKAAGASVAQGADAAKVANTATNLYAKSVHDATSAHSGLSSQAQAAFHAVRGFSEMMAQGVPLTQALAMEMNNLSYAAAGQGGLTGAFKDVGGLVLGMLTPMRLIAGVAGGAAVGMYLLYESVKTTELKFADLQDRIGGTLQSLHGLQSSATLSSGIGSDDFLKNMEKFGELAVEAQHGIGNLAQLFRANGVAISQDVNVNLARTADLVANAANQQEKYRIIQEAGLPPTFQWVRYLSQGGDAILAAARQANGFGDAAEQEMIRKAREFDTVWAASWERFKSEAKTAIIDASGWLDAIIYKGREALIGFDRATGGNGRTVPLNILNNALHGLEPGTRLNGQDANSIYDVFGGTFSGSSVSGRKTRTKEDVLHDLQVEQQHISAMGQLASVEEQVRAKEIAIQQARLNGVPITKAQSDAILQYTRNEALGITALQAQTDAYKIQAQTIGMTTGQAAAYTAVQTRLNEERRKGNTLSPQEIANLTAAANAMGAAKDAAERLQQATELTGNFFNDFGQAMLQGKSGAEAFRSALGSLESSLLRIATNKLAEGLLGGGLFGGGGGFLAHLFGSANGNAFSGGHPIYAFANGGIVSGPTVAPMALMGEAGPEAVMPLRRGPDGRLGVAAGGGGQTVQISVVARFENDGKFKTYLENVSGAVVANAAPHIIGAAVSQAPSASMAASRQSQIRSTRP